MRLSAVFVVFLLFSVVRLRPVRVLFPEEQEYEGQEKKDGGEPGKGGGGGFPRVRHAGAVKYEIGAEEKQGELQEQDVEKSLGEFCHCIREKRDAASPADAHNLAMHRDARPPDKPGAQEDSRPGGQCGGHGHAAGHFCDAAKESGKGGGKVGA